MTPTRLWAAAAAATAALVAGCASPVKLDDTPVENRDPRPVRTSALGGPGTGAAALNPGSGVAAGGAAGGTPLGGGSALASGTVTPQSQVAMVNLNNAPSDGPAMAAQSGRVVYFDFDSFVVREEFRGMIEAHARNLIGNKGRHMVIEGHTDERGGREYNLALGQKRAEAVLKSLTLMGVADGQLEAVSYGKERPVAEGHDEDAWARNRRAELKDR